MLTDFDRNSIVPCCSFSMSGQVKLFRALWESSRGACSGVSEDCRGVRGLLKVKAPFLKLLCRTKGVVVAIFEESAMLPYL
jgi:hypothetical protein